MPKNNADLIRSKSAKLTVIESFNDLLLPGSAIASNTPPSPSYKGVLIVALVLPFRPYVEANAEHKPSGTSRTSYFSSYLSSLIKRIVSRDEFFFKGP
jgi:hypothetical protein